MIKEEINDQKEKEFKIPKGYYQVTTGIIYSKDMWHNEAFDQFEPVTSEQIGQKVSEHACIVCGR